MLRFFNFPRVVLDEVIRCMNPLDLITVSQCSKRSLTLLQYLISHKPYALEIRSDCSISICNEDQKYIIKAWDKDMISNDVVKRDCPKSTLDELKFVIFEFKKGEILTLWDNRFQGFCSLYQHFIAIYKKPIRFLNLNFVHRFQRTLDILSLVYQNQNRIEKCKVIINDSPTQDVNIIFDALQAVDHMSIWIDTKIPNRKYEYKSIQVHPSQSVTVPHLLNMNCDKVSIDRGKYSCRHVNLYLKQWILNDVPRVKEVSLEKEYFDLSESLTDIPHVETKNRSKLDAQFTNIVGTAYDILRCDGVIATVFALENGDRENFELRVFDQ